MAKKQLPHYQRFAQMAEHLKNRGISNLEIAEQLKVSPTFYAQMKNLAVRITDEHLKVLESSYKIELSDFVFEYKKSADEVKDEQLKIIVEKLETLSKDVKELKQVISYINDTK